MRLPWGVGTLIAIQDDADLTSRLPLNFFERLGLKVYDTEALGNNIHFSNLGRRSYSIDDYFLEQIHNNVLFATDCFNYVS